MRELRKIVFVESIDSGVLKPAILNATRVGPEVWRGQVFTRLSQIEALEDQDLHDIAGAMGVEIKSKKETAELLWFRANRTSAIYLGPHAEKDERDMAKKVAATSAKAKRVRKSKTAVKVAGERGRPSDMAGKKIYVKVEENPRRKGTHGHKSFALIKNGMAVEEFVSIGGRLADLRWDLKAKHVEVK